MQVKFVKVVDYTKMWKSKDGTEKPSVGFYAVIDIEGNETWQKFQPTKFSFNTFNLISEVKIKRDEESK